MRKGLKRKAIKEACNVALKQIKPTGKERQAVRKKVRTFLTNLNKELKKIYAKAVWGGSGAKDTWLKGHLDADVFVLFDYSIYQNKSSTISSLLGKVLRKKFRRVKKVHGSRDYYHITDKLGKTSFTFELIPILSIKKPEQAKNITDMSPLHTSWVKKKTRGKKTLLNEIILLKAFCKAHHVYGAESHINGLSGYVCEVLVIYYGSFLKTLLAVSSTWEYADEKIIIDPARYYKTRNVLLELNKSKTAGPLVLIDPVQEDRNAAAAVSEDTLERFILACKEFLVNPAVDCFTQQVHDVEYVRERSLAYPGSKTLLIEIQLKRGKIDIVGCTVRKLYERIRDVLVMHEFSLLEHDWYYDDISSGLIWFIVKNETLPYMRVHPGPPTSMKEAVADFKKSHDVTFVEGKKIFAEEKRKYRKSEQAVQSVLKCKQPSCIKKMKQFHVIE